MCVLCLCVCLWVWVCVRTSLRFTPSKWAHFGKWQIVAGPYFSTPPQRGEGLVLGSKLGVENVMVRHCLEKATQMCVCACGWGGGRGGSLGVPRAAQEKEQCSMWSSFYPFTLRIIRRVQKHNASVQLNMFSWLACTRNATLSVFFYFSIQHKNKDIHTVCVQSLHRRKMSYKKCKNSKQTGFIHLLHNRWATLKETLCKHCLTYIYVCLKRFTINSNSLVFNVYHVCFFITVQCYIRCLSLSHVLRSMYFASV